MRTFAPSAAAATLPGPTTPAPLDAEAMRLDDEGFADRYRAPILLGAGGMGEVHLCTDQRIGREVAVKVMRTDLPRSALTRRRFLREARVQGQLEHPAIVPVHDIGTGDDDEVYFTMKRVRGATLDQLLADLRRGDPDTTARMSQRKLLAALAQVCLAIDFAHARGVVHRDLKPANLMLGDFGEVYVLDWGLARVGGDGDDAPEALPLLLPREMATASSSVLGTPGYMAPEQLRGESDARADVYALGAILCEILTLLPLHGGDSVDEVIRSTMRGARVAEVVKASGLAVPPELEAICVKATAKSPADRYADARALHDAIDAYLEGDRDLERRRAASREHGRAALQAFARSRDTSADEEALRGRAMREVTRSLALDPDNPTAAETLMRLLAEPPRTLPLAVKANLERWVDANTRRWNGVGTWAFAMFLALMPIAWGARTRDGGLFCVGETLLLVAGVVLTRLASRAASPRKLTYAVLVVASVALAWGTGLFGPFVCVPGIAGLLAIMYGYGPDPHFRRAGAIASFASIFVPFGLQQAGLVDTHYGFSHGVMTIRSGLLELTETETMVTLGFVTLIAAVLPAFLSGIVHQEIQRSIEQQELKAWHLAQLARRRPE